MPSGATAGDLSLWARPASEEGFRPFGRLLEVGAALRLGRRGGVTTIVQRVQPGPERFQALDRYPDARRLLVPLTSLEMRILVAGTGDPPSGVPAAFVTAPGQGVLLAPGVWHAGPIPSAKGRILEVLETPSRYQRLDRRPVQDLLGHAAIRVRQADERFGPEPGLDLESPAGVLVEPTFPALQTVALLLLEDLQPGAPSPDLLAARRERIDALVKLAGKRGDVGGRFGVDTVRALWRQAGLDPQAEPPPYEMTLRRILAGDDTPPADAIEAAAELASLGGQLPVQVLDAACLLPPLALRRGGEAETLDEGADRPRPVEGVPVLADGEGPVAAPWGVAARARASAGTSSALLLLSMASAVERTDALLQLEAASDTVRRFCGGREAGRRIVGAPSRPPA